MQFFPAVARKTTLVVPPEPGTPPELPLASPAAAANGLGPLSVACLVLRPSPPHAIPIVSPATAATPWFSPRWRSAYPPQTKLFVSPPQPLLPPGTRDLGFHPSIQGLGDGREFRLPQRPCSNDYSVTLASNGDCHFAVFHRRGLRKSGVTGIRLLRVPITPWAFEPISEGLQHTGVRISHGDARKRRIPERRLVQTARKGGGNIKAAASVWGGDRRPQAFRASLRARQ